MDKENEKEILTAKWRLPLESERNNGTGIVSWEW